MRVIKDLKDIPMGCPRISVALGMFDGVHIGHQSIIRHAVELARTERGTAAVLTFSNHPLSVLAPERQPLSIGCPALRREIVQELGVDLLVDIPFSKELSVLSPEDFLRLLQERMAPVHVVTGPNFTFGFEGKGTGKTLMEHGREFGFTAEVCPAVMRHERPVSSTRVRILIAEGRLALVNEFLGRCFVYRGQVVHGDERGRTIGFPTANLEIPETQAMLPKGVYAVRVRVGDEPYIGMANIGNNPTFAGERKIRMEVHIDRFAQDIYDEFIEVGFVERLRGEQKFDSAERLVGQLRQDLENVRRILA